MKVADLVAMTGMDDATVTAAFGRLTTLQIRWFPCSPRSV
jgi:hypothetical protein